MARGKKRRYVYFFGGGKAEGKAGMKALLGGKGANLAEMTSLGLPVPPGFTISTQACAEYYEAGKRWPVGLKAEVDRALERLEKVTKKTFGYGDNPLLVSVRSGAAVSMPGMMDTVLNLGLNSATLEALIRKTGNERFAWDAFRRFIQMFGDVVMGVEHEAFEHCLDGVKEEAGVKLDTDLGVEDLKKVVARYKALYKRHTGEVFPEDPRIQLEKAISAVFGSWNNPRAIRYRELNDIRGLLGTAVNVQTMVFGNMGDRSGTGVCFTRNPSTGENKFYGEFLMNAQGEDVVAGIRTPEPIEALKKVMPAAYKKLYQIRGILEKHYKDMQDIEFTIEDGALYMLQTRTGKRTAAAAVKIAVDMVKERLIDRKTALLRINPNDLDQLLHPQFDPRALKAAKPITKGLPASPGAATGQLVFSAEAAEKAAAKGKDVILCRIETSPEDIGGMDAARGILTARGGMTSHAAVVARGMGKCCVAGAGTLRIDYKARKMSVEGRAFREGDWISLDGSTGFVYAGKIDTVDPKLSGNFATIMKWADQYRKLGVRTNADTPHDTEVAVKFGAEGIGLCRTEHMFFEGRRITSFRRLILVADTVKRLEAELAAEEDPKRRKAIAAELRGPRKQYDRALRELLPLQRRDFEGIFAALKGRPCTIRLLDPPLHEFLPHDVAGQREMAKAMGVTPEEIRRRVEELAEFNPMLGHRGCRLGLTFPEVSEMQVRAIIEAAANCKKKRIPVKPEIMIPLVGNVAELRLARERAEKVIARVLKERGLTKKQLPYLIGTMIEVPRAAVTADQIATEAEFFSFGTNDLTQMGCGFSRDDAGRFLGEYVKLGIYEYDPFQVLDTEGVGRLIETAVRLGRGVRKGLKLGICGEHGGEPRSIAFAHKVGLTYVSCSPFRVPIARLAAAHAALRES
ncbi:MAG: pyruvate, phosphate dikinase [Candidatus Hydrogenedentota bacterium]|nr:MAG: pyruvate, phosphate dikinase [Candidatus Hydrogenedentota bacterium]